jgi:3-oxoacyl-[acyl-carrier protein] reductase
MKGIKDKRILVTGSSSGIGKEIAITLGNYSNKIGIHYNQNKDDAEKLSSKIYQADISKEEDCKKLINDFVKDFNGIDILINNAGGYKSIPILELTKEDWNETLNLNLLGPYYLSREAIKYMKEQRFGRIINISSTATTSGGGYLSLHYATAKRGLESLTQGLAKFGAQYNINVNAIRPGVIDTPFHKDRDKDYMDSIIKKIPLGIGKPEDIANMVCYLVSEYGNYITGQIITISGGYDG